MKKTSEAAARLRPGKARRRRESGDTRRNAARAEPGGAGSRAGSLHSLLALLALPLVAACTQGALRVEPAALPSASAVQRPNILLVYSDDHAQNAVSAYGGGLNHTPNLDRLAREGARFSSSFVGNSLCAPARASALTGLHSHAHGVLRNGDELDPSLDTFPERLQAAGYRTALVGKWHLRSAPAGFDHYQVLLGQGTYYDPELESPSGRTRIEGYTTEILTDLALRWLEEQRTEDAPFLLMVQHKAPHRRWLPGPDQLDLFQGADFPEPPTLFDDYAGRASGAATQEMTIARHLDEHDLKLLPAEELTEEQLARWNAAYGPSNAAFRASPPAGKDLVRWKYRRYLADYLRCVQAVDDSVGRLLDYLDEHGLTDDTVVIYTSDQGFYLGEHGWYDKRWMYEESLRTPLLVRWPERIPAGSVVDELVQNVDLAPTLLSLAGEESSPRVHGRSFLPLLTGRGVRDWRTSIYYRYYEFPGVHAVPKHVGVRTDRYKLIRFDELGEWELFDLARDPYELHSVWADPVYQDVRAELETELERLAEGFGDRL